jgi:NADPH2:quinone reductase
VRAIQITEFGGPEVLRLVELPDPVPGDGLKLLEVDSAGVNFADTHQTENSYLAPQRLPMVPGAEAVGRLPDGRRVVALLAGGGGYAERALAHPATTVDVPDGVEDGDALALILQGTTAWHLLRRSTHMQPGESVLVHAAAGGVGSLAVQLARQWGAGRVVATASTAEKRRLATELGAHAAVDVSSFSGGEQVRDALVEANGGRGFDVVLEMTGGPVLDGSIAALAPFGRLVSYGMASRTPGVPLQVADLMATSRTVAGFWLVNALRLPGGLTGPMDELLSLTQAGALRPVIGGTYPLAEAAEAHRALLSRRSTGKLVLDVRASRRARSAPATPAGPPPGSPR